MQEKLRLAIFPTAYYFMLNLHRKENISANQVRADKEIAYFCCKQAATIKIFIRRDFVPKCIKLMMLIENYRLADKNYFWHFLKPSRGPARLRPRGWGPRRRTPALEECRALIIPESGKWIINKNILICIFKTNPNLRNDKIPSVIPSGYFFLFNDGEH